MVSPLPTYSISIEHSIVHTERKGFMRKQVHLAPGKYKVPAEISYEVAAELIQQRKAEKIVRGRTAKEIK